MPASPRISLATLLLSGWLLLSAKAGNQLTVSPSEGLDNGDCTSTACQTIEYAYGVSSDHDVISVSESATILLRATLHLGRNVTLEGRLSSDGRPAVLLDCSGADVNAILVSNSSSRSISVQLRSMQISNCREGGILVQGNLAEADSATSTVLTMNHVVVDR